MMDLKEKLRQIIGPNNPVYESIFAFDETNGCESHYVITLAHAVTGGNFTLTENFPGLIRNDACDYNPYNKGFNVKGFREKYFNELYYLTVANIEIDTKRLFFKWADKIPPNKNHFLDLPLLPDNLEIHHFSSIIDYLQDQVPEDWLNSVGLNRGNSALFKFRSDFQRITYYLTPLDKSMEIFNEFRKEYMEKHADKVFVIQEPSNLSYFRNRF